MIEHGAENEGMLNEGGGIDEHGDHDKDIAVESSVQDNELGESAIRTSRQAHLDHKIGEIGGSGGQDREIGTSGIKESETIDESASNTTR